LNRFLAPLLLAVLAAGCAAPARTPPPAQGPGGEIVVFAASSLADAFNEMGERFRAANPGSTVSFNFGASPQLVTQLDQGAAADAFASADQIQMERATATGRIAGEPRVFARNRLIVITPAANPSGLASPADLAKPGLKVVTSQPDVPVGVYTQEMLDRISRDPRFGSDFKARVNANVVSQEANVRQILAKVQLGEADAAVVYRSDVTPQAESQVRIVHIPNDFNVIATYPIAVVRGSPNPAGAAAFIDFVLSPEGQSVLARWNFIPARAHPPAMSLARGDSAPELVPVI